MAENIWPEQASRRKIFEEGLDKGVKIFNKGIDKGIEITREISPPTKAISASSTDWLTSGACSLMAAPMIYSVGKHMSDLMGKYLAYRTEEGSSSPAEPQ